MVIRDSDGAPVERGSVWLGTVLALLFVAPVGALAASVTISNHSSTALALYDPAEGRWLSTNFCGNPGAPSRGVGQTFQLEGYQRSYMLTPAGGSPQAGHAFDFVGGNVLRSINDANCYTPGHMGYWDVDPSNAVIRIRGMAVTFSLVSTLPGQDHELFRVNPGSEGTASLNGEEFETHLIPADGNFDGIYTNITFPVSGSSPGTLTLGWATDIVNWSGNGHGFTWTGPRSIRVTTDKGVVFDVRAGPVYREAEAMPVSDTNGWSQAVAEGASEGRVILGTFGGQATASQSVRIGRAGVYRVWIRHFYYANALGPFRMAVRQNGMEVRQAVFHDRKIEAFGFAGFVWECLEVPLSRGTADIVFTKVEPFGSNTLKLDCMVVTDDPLYNPAVFVHPLYVKVKLSPAHSDACAIRFEAGAVVRLDRQSAALGAHWGVDPDRPGPEALRGGDETPWFNIAPCLSNPNGDNTVRIRAIQKYSSIWTEGLPSSSFTVQIASNPTPSGVFREFSRSGPGCGLLMNLNLTDRDRIASDLDMSREALLRGGASLRAATPGRRPDKFPVMTQCASVSSFFGSATVSNEIRLLTDMGFNSIGAAGYDPIYFASGFTKLMGSQRALDLGLASNIVAFGFRDEPSSVPYAEIIGGSNYQAGFRTYLSGLGLAPGFFGKASWGEILPTTNKAASPREFYYTVKYRNRLFTDLCQPETQELLGRMPAAPYAANFGEDATFYGNALEAGIDMFDTLGPRNGLMMGWTEDWLNWSVTYQLCGYRAELLRAACRPCNKPFGMYCLWRSPWDIQAKAACQIGRGSSRIYYYSYGPRYSGMDGASQSYDTYPALRRINHAIGAVEDYLAGAVPVRSPIALLYSHTTDAWTLDQKNSVFGKDRMGLYLMLTHLGYPVELVTEDEVAGGKLSAYRMLVCDASHVRREALAPLLSWLKDGGVLYVGPGSLSFDEFNDPLGFDREAGIERAPFVLRNEPGRELYDFPELPVLARVSHGDEVFESLCGFQTAASLSGAVVTNAVFDNRSLAAFTKGVGKGKLEFCGFFPGLAYQKAGMLSKRARDAQSPFPATYGSTDYPAGARVFFNAFLAQSGYAPPIRTSHYLLEANRLENTNGTVITLSNWTGAPLENATVTFARGGRQGAPWTVLHPIRDRVEHEGLITLTLDIAGPADFIVLPQAAP